MTQIRHSLDLSDYFQTAMAPLLAAYAMRSPGLSRWECSYARSRYRPGRPATRAPKKGGREYDLSNWETEAYNAIVVILKAWTIKNQ
jgi:hypothetical protein